jgi:hypothetical protein
VVERRGEALVLDLRGIYGNTPNNKKQTQ